MVSLFQQSDGLFSIVVQHSGKALARDLPPEAAIVMLTACGGEELAHECFERVIQASLTLDESLATTMLSEKIAPVAV